MIRLSPNDERQAIAAVGLLFAVGHRMNKSQLTLFNPEFVAVRSISNTAKLEKNADDTNGLVYNVPSIWVGVIESRGYSNITGIVLKPSTCIRTSFQPLTWISPRHRKACILEEIEISVACCLDCFSGVSLIKWDLAPVL